MVYQASATLFLLMKISVRDALIEEMWNDKKRRNYLYAKVFFGQTSGYGIEFIYEKKNRKINSANNKLVLYSED